MSDREKLRSLVEQLPETEVGTAVRVLEALRDTADPLVRVLDEAPEDDEPVTDEDVDDIRAGLEAHRRGQGISADEAKRRLLG